MRKWILLILILMLSVIPLAPLDSSAQQPAEDDQSHIVQFGGLTIITRDPIVSGSQVGNNEVGGTFTELNPPVTFPSIFPSPVPAPAPPTPTYQEPTYQNQWAGQQASVPSVECNCQCLPCDVGSGNVGSAGVTDDTDLSAPPDAEPFDDYDEPSTQSLRQSVQ